MEITLTNENFEQEVLNSEIPVIVDFWATWCGPCRMLAPTIEEIAKEYEGKIKVGKVDCDDNEELAVKYNIFNIPCVLLFKEGQVIKTSVGYKTKEELLKIFEL